jgi:ABC-type multidrug transport system fused ATPase/permease subunit
MPQLTILRTLFKKHRWQLIVTYFLFSLEMLASLLRPFFLGETVNDLFKGSYRGLIILSIVHFGYLIVGTLRHRYDTRTYSSIYTSLVTKFLSRRYAAKDVSRLAAHSTLAKEFIEFLEFDFVYVMEAIYNLFGSLVLLCFYDAHVVAICLGILLPVVAASYFYGRKMKRLNLMKNDELEQQVDIISAGNHLAIRRHYSKLREWQIKISDQEAWNFGFMELMVMIVVGLSILVTPKAIASSMMAGSFIGIYSYLDKFCKGLETIPYTVQRMSSLSDITRRIELQTEDFNDEPELKVVNE